MSRLSRVLLLLLLLLLLGVAVNVGIWFFTNMEHYDEKINTGPAAEARQNSLLAAERLLRGLGEIDESAVNLDSVRGRLGAHDVLVLPWRGKGVSSEINRQLLAWVHVGGNLIVVAEPDWLDDDGLDNAASESNAVTGYDPLLTPLGVSGRRLSASSCGAEKTLSVTLPDGVSLTLANDRFNDTLRSGSVTPWFADKSGVHLLGFHYGKGALVVLNDADILQNSALDKNDHGELLWRLTRLLGAPGKVWLVFSGRAPSLWSLLCGYWWQPMFACAALALLIVWRSAARFGPMLPARASDRRSLLEHIDACGRWYWQRRQHAQLLDHCRTALKQRLATRHPLLAHLAPDALVRELAALSGLPEAQIETALTADTGKQQSKFVTIVSTLQILRNTL